MQGNIKFMLAMLLKNAEFGSEETKQNWMNEKMGFVERVMG